MKDSSCELLLGGGTGTTLAKNRWRRRRPLFCGEARVQAPPPSPCLGGGGPKSQVPAVRGLTRPGDGPCAGFIRLPRHPV